MRIRGKTIHEFQELMKKTYIHRDKHRGIYGTLLWMISEIGEFTSAVLEKDQKEAAEEAADIFAWLCSVCNLFGIDLAKASFEKYGKGCPRCHHIPCLCQTR